MRGKGSVLALVAFAAALSVAGGALVLGREAAVESWHIARLRWGPAAGRVTAARALARMRSVRAVPHLIAAIRGDEAVGVAEGGAVSFYQCSQGSPMPDIRDANYFASPLVFALHELRVAGLAAIRSALSAEMETAAVDSRMARILIAALDGTKSWVEAGTGR